ncbi:MAG: site-specific DNA-methyltransferase, partial [Gemmatimonadetes bacterium]|nr:site-specific DNA-methyltransferase [Gemmatimonadota bacterium]
MSSYHRVVLGDSRSMDQVDDEAAQLVVTSPPYWQLKDYGHEEQVGFS